MIHVTSQLPAMLGMWQIQNDAAMLARRIMAAH